MRDSDWLRKFLLRSDWLLRVVASMTTTVHNFVMGSSNSDNGT